MRFPVYSIKMIIRDYNNLLIRAGTNHILFDFSLKLRRELLNHNSGAYSIFIPIQIVLYAVFPHPTTVQAWFELFGRSPVLGLIGFDLLYLISNVFMIFLLLGLFLALIKKNLALTLLAGTLGLISITIFFSSNRCVEMLQVSAKYLGATTDSERLLYLSAGEVFESVWKGTSYFVYYVMNGVSLILFFLAMKKDNRFRKSTFYSGLSSGVLMLVPATVGIVGMVMALFSLIPWMAFCILVSRDFLRLAKNT